MENKEITLTSKIEELNLYIRAYNFLKRHSINTIWQLLAHTEKELSEMKDSEWMIIQVIKTKIESLGFHLGMSEEELKSFYNRNSSNKEVELLEDESIISFQKHNNSLRDAKEIKTQKLKTLTKLLHESIRLEEENRLLDEQIAEIEEELNLKNGKVK